MARRIISRKQQIIKEGTRLFGESGYDKITVKQIAEACEITEPAVYRHFSSKDDLYLRVLEGLEDRLTHEALFENLEQSDNVEDLLRGVANHIVNFFSENADIYRLLLFAALRGHTHTSETYRLIRGCYHVFLKEELDRMFKVGLIVKKNNEITARCFVGMVFDCALGMTLWKGMQGRVFTPEEVIANNVPIYVRGLIK